MKGDIFLTPPDGATAVARLPVGGLEVLSQSDVLEQETRVLLELRPSELDVFGGKEGEFAALITETVNSADKVFVSVEGLVEVEVETAIGILSVAMPFTMKQGVQGLGGLSGANSSSFFELSDMTVVGADEEFLDAVASLRLRLPGDDCVLGVDLGSIALDIDVPVPSEVLPMLDDLDDDFKQQNLLLDDALGPLVTTGVVKLDRLLIPSPAKRKKMLKALEAMGGRGQPQQRADGGELPPDTANAVLFAPVKTRDGIELRAGTRLLMSNYVNGLPSTIVIRSNALTTKNELLLPFFKNLRVQTTIDGTDKAFIKEVSISVKLRNFQPVVEAVSVFENPTDATIKFRYAKLETFFDGR
ncbi:hypothetical protein ACSSS7_005100 [Eimeria intestinalis]